MSSSRSRMEHQPGDGTMRASPATAPLLVPYAPHMLCPSMVLGARGGALVVPSPALCSLSDQTHIIPITHGTG